MAAPILTQLGTKVRVTWTAPDNGGSPISAYYVEFNDGGYGEKWTICDGTDFNKVSQMFCDIEMADIRTTLTTLSLGDPI